MTRKLRNTNSAVVWRGRSKLDGSPIMLVVSGLARSDNRKTGNLLQTYILRTDLLPTEAMRLKLTAAICGDCPYQYGQGCYVNIGQGPQALWKSWRRGRMLNFNAAKHAPAMSGRILRMGSYGDPAAVPAHVWRSLLKYTNGQTGYTHAWRKPAGSWLKGLCMASCDSMDDYRDATARGWRSFLILPTASAGRSLTRFSPYPIINCPASTEAGQRTTCDRCGLCSGNAKPNLPSIYIAAHGGPGQIAGYRRLMTTLSA